MSYALYIAEKHSLFTFYVLNKINRFKIYTISALKSHFQTTPRPTADVKLIDVWLIFSQLIPFVSVLLHTFMDNMRSEGGREINHHGEVRKIKPNVIHVEELDGSRPASGPGYQDMTQRNEEELVDARRAFYANAKVQVHLLNYGEIAGKRRH